MERFWLDDSNPGDPPHTNTYTWEYDAIGRLIDEAFESDLPDLQPVKFPGSSRIPNGSFPSGNTFSIDYDKDFKDNGFGRLRIEIRRGTANAILDGKWQLEIVAGQLQNNLLIDAWIDRTDPRRVQFINHLSEERTLSVPGTAKSVITVGAIRSNVPIRVGDFSAFGKTRDDRCKPEIVAPGIDIFAARSNTANGLRSKHGTSMAAPHVTGAVALVLSAVNKRADLALPNASQIQRALEKTAQYSNGVWDRGSGFGLLDADALLTWFLN